MKITGTIFRSVNFPLTPAVGLQSFAVDLHRQFGSDSAFKWLDIDHFLAFGGKRKNVVKLLISPTFLDDGGADVYPRTVATLAWHAHQLKPEISLWQWSLILTQ